MDNGVTYPDEGLDAFAAPTDGHHLARNRRAAHSSAHMTTHLRYVYVNIVCTLCVPLALARVSIFFVLSFPFRDSGGLEMGGARIGGSGGCASGVRTGGSG